MEKTANVKTPPDGKKSGGGGGHVLGGERIKEHLTITMGKKEKHQIYAAETRCLVIRFWLYSHFTMPERHMGGLRERAH